MEKFISATEVFKILHLKGTYFEMGVQHGQQLKADIAFAIERCVHAWGVKQQNWRKESIYDFAIKSVKKAPLRIRQELEGVASGSGIDYKDILAWNYLDDYWEVCQCSAFAAKGSLVSDGRMMVGRNNDYDNDYSNEISVTIVREPLFGNITITNTWAGTIGTYEGINEHGLVVTTQFSQTFDRNEAGISVKHKNLALLEEYGSVAETVASLVKDHPNFGCNILVADSESSSVVECSFSGVTVRTEMEERSISTNHYVKHVCYPAQDTPSFLTKERYQYLEDQLHAHKGNLDILKIKSILTTGPVIKAGPVEYTTRCAIYIPESREIHVAHGLLPASDGAFLRLNLNEILKDRKLLCLIPLKQKQEDTEYAKISAAMPSPFQDLNWDVKKTQSLANRVLEVWADYLKGLPALPVLNLSSAATVKESMTFDIPEKGLSEDALVEYSRKLLFTHATHTGHPGFLAYIMGTGTLPGTIADFIASAMNQNVGGWNLGPSAAEIETRLLQWFAQLFGLPDSALGLTMVGGAIANLTALKVARDTIGGMHLRQAGLARNPQLVLYCSERAHVTIDRAADMLGLGIGALRKVETDENFRMNIDRLTEAIEADINLGNKPFAVVGTAGTTSFGSIDPLKEIAQVCKKNNLWFHVDGAYGAMAILSELGKNLFDGIELADSITFDPHKWLYISQSASCVLFRDMRHAEAAFVIDDDYVYEDKEETKTGIDFSDYGPQWSRGFSALKIWFSLIAHGRESYSQRITQDILLTRYFSEIVRQHPDFELAMDPNLSVCCFRYKPQKLPAFIPAQEELNCINGNNPDECIEPYLNRLNQKLLTAIQLNGRFFPSSANLNGKFLLRICIVNFRTEAVHLYDFLELLSTTGNELNQQHMGSETVNEDMSGVWLNEI